MAKFLFTITGSIEAASAEKAQELLNDYCNEHGDVSIDMEHGIRELLLAELHEEEPPRRRNEVCGEVKLVPGGQFRLAVWQADEDCCYSIVDMAEGNAKWILKYAKEHNYPLAREELAKLKD